MLNHTEFGVSVGIKKEGKRKMRINTFNLYLNDDCNPVLVKERGQNYTEIDALKKPEDVVKVMNEIFNFINSLNESKSRPVDKFLAMSVLF